jgi:hypothetical protein
MRLSLCVAHAEHVERGFSYNLVTRQEGSRGLIRHVTSGSKQASPHAYPPQTLGQDFVERSESAQ